MPSKRYSPVTPGLRFRISTDFNDITKDSPDAQSAPEEAAS